jgi:RNA polymerase sigma-70 factor (ECF subfamily)
MTTAEYNACVDIYADSIYRFVLKNIKDKDLAKDIVQDTFEKVWLKVAEIDYEKVKSYLFTVAHHTMIDSIRKSKRTERMNPEDEMHDHLIHSGYTNVKEVLRKALDKLSDIQRAVILLRDYEGYNYQEIGEITGLNESQVKVYIYRARVILKEYIGNIHQVI